MFNAINVLLQPVSEEIHDAQKNMWSLIITMISCNVLSSQVYSTLYSRNNAHMVHIVNHIRFKMVYASEKKSLFQILVSSS